MWLEFLLEGVKKFSGEIIGLILLAVFWRMFPGLRNWFKTLKKDDADDVDVRQALETIQRRLEAQQMNVRPVDALKADEIQIFAWIPLALAVGINACLLFLL